MLVRFNRFNLMTDLNIQNLHTHCTCRPIEEYEVEKPFIKALIKKLLQKS